MKFLPLLLSTSTTLAQRPLSDGYTVARYRTRYVIKGFETLADLNGIMSEMEASALTAESHFKTRYLSMMLSWLMDSQDHTAFADYGCHCQLDDVAERKPFVGYTNNPKTTPYRFELGYRGDDRVIRCVGAEHDDDQCQENLCQCDRRLAMALARRVNNIKDSNKQLDRATQCTINDKQEQFTSCCGTVKTFPFNQPAHEDYCCDGPIRASCFNL